MIVFAARLNKLLDFIYPPTCHHCDTPTSEGRYLCSQCLSDSIRISQPFCAGCSESYDGSINNPIICPNCKQIGLNFNFARSALQNTHANHQLIVDFKYLKKFYLANELALFCVEAMTNDPRFADLDSPVLIPIPLHWRRKWHRGFNQAAEISRQIARHTGLPMCNALRRKHHTETQTNLGKSGRLENIKGAFTFKKLDSKFKSIILVDDVFTTGSTAAACAEVLKKHLPDIENIVVLTALRG